ncbi:MAG TPA: hypothetical protein VNM90_30760 [Haliangium sp.]|nr:hypothetical protein [Haliangium sp.]
MEELINGLVSKVGLDKNMAEKVVAFLKEHADDVPKWLASAGVGSSLAGRLPGGLGDALGGFLGKKD